jgi:hypothetical protein
MTTDELGAALLKAIEAEDGDAFEEALTSAYRDGPRPELAELCARALLFPWHELHEDLVGYLQELKDPRTVEPLFQAAHARHAYLDYDEFFGLARKCTWALADIGTPEARARLEDLARSDNDLIAGYARKRLAGWQQELPREGR